ncbi:hypothetical protein RHECNPAF_2530053 [Rhizobium etli CNPAF512]|nr:hypothetical protein RHECNPAF_2530053 [Rhizobium etli CNPAF512]
MTSRRSRPARSSGSDGPEAAIATSSRLLPHAGD